MCSNRWDMTILDLTRNGWVKVDGGEGPEGPVLHEDEVLATWQEYDIAADLVELVGLVFGVAAREVVSRLALGGNLAEASIHVKGNRLRQADVWLTVTDDEEVFDGIYVRADGFVSPEVLEMIEVAAVGDEA
jgi:hypothetical protein